MSELYKEESTALIPHTLGEAEIRQRGCELASALEEIELLEGERKAAMKVFKDRLEDAATRVVKLRHIVGSGVEMIETPAGKVFDFSARRVWWETDDGRRFHERDMRDDEAGKASRPMFEADDGEVM